jgi:O-antigen/teichoic acid export membrane protein
MSARLLLAPIVFAIVAALAWSTPVLGDTLGRILATAAFAVALGVTPLWYFQGKARPAFAAVLELVSALISLGAILVFVRTPEDIAVTLIALTLGPVLSFGYGIVLMYREVGTAPFRLRRAVAALRQGLPIFLVYASTSLQTVASTWLIAFLATVDQAAFFGVAHRLTNIVIAAAFEPIAQVSVPKSVSLVGAPQKLWPFVLRLLGVHLVLAMGGVIGLYLFTDFVVHLVFSPEMAPSTPATFVLSLALLPLALSRTFNFYWLVPSRRDRNVAIAVASGSAVVVGLAILTVPDLGAMGMAWSRVAGELAAAVLVLAFAVRVRIKAGRVPSDPPSDSR